MPDKKVIDPKLPVKSTFALGDARAMQSMANQLKEFVVEAKLFTVIQNKKYVNVEGWQYAGNLLGLIASILKCQRVQGDDPSEKKYMAVAVVQKISTGERVGGKGYAWCSNREYSKKLFDEYAIASMAQTRAVGKVYRLLIGWLLKSAGFEPTPGEEMEGVKSTSTATPTKAPEPKTKPKPTKKEAAIKKKATPKKMSKILDESSVKMLKTSVTNCTLVEELKDIWDSYPGLQTNTEFKKLMADRKAEIISGVEVEIEEPEEVEFDDLENQM